MKLFDYLEARYMKLNLEIQREFSLAKQAETQAVHNLITASRAVLRFFAYPKIIVLFVLTKVGAIEGLKSPKEQAEALVAATNVVAINTEQTPPQT